jgi:hypothetical protein
VESNLGDSTDEEDDDSPQEEVDVDDEIEYLYGTEYLSVDDSDDLLSIYNKVQISRPAPVNKKGKQVTFQDQTRTTNAVEKVAKGRGKMPAAAATVNSDSDKLDDGTSISHDLSPNSPNLQSRLSLPWTFATIGRANAP